MAPLVGMLTLPLVGIDAGHALAELRDQRRRPIEVARARHPRLEHIAAQLVLELGGGALCDDHAGVHHDDPVREVLRLLHVLGRQQHRRAAGDEILDEAPHVVAGAGIQARGRLVQEQDPRAADQAGPDVKAAAHPARVGLDELLGGVGERETLEHLLGATAALGLAQLVEEPHELEVLAAGEQLVDRGELAGEADQRAQPRGVRDHVAAGHAWHVRCPRRNSVARIRTSVVLPAPLGPSSASTLPSSATRSKSARACVDPNRLLTPSTSIIDTAGL